MVAFWLRPGRKSWKNGPAYIKGLYCIYNIDQYYKNVNISQERGFKDRDHATI